MRRYQSALLGGLFIGVLSGLPVVGALNYCCCLWVVVGGILTVYLQQQNQPEPVEASDAAVNGLIAGLVGAVVYVALTAAIVGVSGDAMQNEFRSAIENNPQVPPEVRDRLLGLLTGGRIVLLLAAVSLPVYAVVAMLGSLLGVAIFRKKTPPPAPDALP